MKCERALPCPFCGGKDIRFDCHKAHTSPTGEIWSMCCYDCGAQFPNRYKKELLLTAWNMRHINMDNLILNPCKCGEVPELLFDIVQNTYYKPYVPCSACKEKVEHPSHVSWGYKDSADLIVCDKWNIAMWTEESEN